MATRAIPYEAELPPTRHASLWPREHGTYVQLLAPLLSAMLVIPPTVAGLLMAIAACAAFLGTEAVVIAKGGRGARRQRADGDRAVQRARACAGIVIASGCAGLLVAPRPAVELALLVSLPATLSLVLATRRSIHTLPGELLAALTLAGTAAPIAAAAGMPRADALTLWMAWSIGLGAAVLAARGVVARARKANGLGLVNLLGYAIAAVSVLYVPAFALALPLLVASAVVVVIAPGAKQLTTVGIALAIVAALSVALSVAIW